jgi:hypothetical protein
MPTPKTEKDVRRFLGRLNYIARFISQLTTTCDPIFHLLKKSVLGQHDETGRKERVIYYLIKKFTECESRYTVIEKMCCALAWATKRWHQYMLYHTMVDFKIRPIKVHL